MFQPLASEIDSEFRYDGLSPHLLTCLAIIVAIVDISNLTGYHSWWRCVPPVLLIVVYGFATRWHMPSMGLNLTPKQGWRYWFRLSIKLGLAMSLVLAVSVMFSPARDSASTVLPTTDPHFIIRWLASSCLFYPIVEESVYRLGLCTPMAMSLGNWWTVAVSGIAFAVLHLCYGNVAAENQIGGFILAWAYLKSESILVPLLLHSLGNLCIILARVACSL